VGRRLQNSSLAFDEKHPMLLPATHEVTRLIFGNKHRQFKHCGPQAPLANTKLQFWTVKEKQDGYLQELQTRSKWTRKQKTVAVRDLVVIKEDNMPPLQWPLGRVVTVHGGKDNPSRQHPDVSRKMLESNSSFNDLTTRL